MRFFSVRRKILEERFGKIWRLGSCWVVFAKVDFISIMPTITKIQPIE